MARIEWVRQRLENWALWHERGAGGGLGFASQSSFLNDAATNRYREAWVPVDEVEAAVTDQAVSALRLTHAHLVETICQMYLTGSGIQETARSRQLAESTIHAHLSQADARLAVWFADRKRMQEQARKNMEAQLAAARPVKLEGVSIAKVKPKPKRGKLRLRG